MKYIIFILPFFLDKPLFAQDTTDVLGYVKYKPISNTKYTSLSKSDIITTLFGKTDNYISYFNDIIEDTRAFAKEITKLQFGNSEEGEAFLLIAEKDAIKMNEKEAKNIKKAFIINTKSKQRKTIHFFNFIKQPNCVVIDTLKKPIEYIFQDSIKIILGYECKKMVFKNTKTIIDVWYTEQLPFNAGPSYFHGAPGVILSAREPVSGRGYTAIEVGGKNSENFLIKRIPFKYKNLITTQKEYEILSNKEGEYLNSNMLYRTQKY